MSEWKSVLEFYEHFGDITKFPREGEMWDEIRNHCNNALTYISKVRNHDKLSSFEPFLIWHDLCLLNNQTHKYAQMYFGIDNEIRVTVVDATENPSKQLDEFTVSSDELIERLVSILCSVT